MSTMSDTTTTAEHPPHFGKFAPNAVSPFDEGRGVSDVNEISPAAGSGGGGGGGDPEAWTSEVGFTVKKHWRQKPALLRMKETPRCIKILSRINKIYFEEAIVQREKPKTVCAVTDSREAIHFTAERIFRSSNTGGVDQEENDKEEDVIRLLLKDPRNNPVLEMKITNVGRLYFTRRCTRAVITYASEDDLVFTFKEISSNVLVSTRYVYRLYRGIINDDDDESMLAEEQEDKEEDAENNNDTKGSKEGVNEEGENHGDKMSETKPSGKEDEEKDTKEKQQKKDERDEQDGNEEEDEQVNVGGKPREMVEIQRHGFMSCARAGGTVELIYLDGSSETAEISDTDHDCFRIHYRLVLGFPRSADPVTKTLLIAGMILSSPKILRYVANL